MYCKICYHNYDEKECVPYTINPCGHYYCLKCLNNLTPKRCPMDRGKIESMTKNRAILDIIGTTDVNSTDGKLIDSLNRSLFGEIIDLETGLIEATNSKVKECKEFFKSMNEKIQNETEIKINNLISDCSKLQSKLITFEEVTIARLSNQTTDLNSKIALLKSELTKEFNIDHLKKESQKIKDMQEAAKKYLENATYYFRFRPAIDCYENKIGHIETELYGKKIFYNFNEQNREARHKFREKSKNFTPLIVM